MEKTIKFNHEQKDKIAQEAIDSKNQKAVAIKYGVSAGLLYSWVRNLRNKSTNISKRNVRQQQQRIDDLELEVKVLKELLKKTTQTLIKE